MNYRKYYEGVTRRKLSVREEVHHINLDRTDNHISNLVAISRELHSRFHKCVNHLSSIRLEELVCVEEYADNTRQSLLHDLAVLSECHIAIRKAIEERDLLLLAAGNVRELRNIGPSYYAACSVA